jgi:hypothetical protein
MKNLFATAGTIGVLALALTACGGGDDSSSSGSGALTGVWAGYYEYGGSLGHGLTVSVDGSTITAVARDGSSLGLTGAISAVQGGIFEFTLYAGATEMDAGGFMVDGAANHAAILTQGGDFGVLQKNGPTTGTWAAADAIGSWSGYSIALNSTGDIISYDSSSATVDINGNIIGSGPFGGFTGALSTYHTGYGYYTGTWSNPSQGTSGDLLVWISADKTFAASYACLGSSDPSWGLEYCTYNSWNKQ